MQNILIIFMLLSLAACNRDELLRQSAIHAATRFASEKIDSAVVVTDNNGVVTIGDEMVRYVIDPENVFYDDIDELSGKDILITIDSLHDPYLMPSWHLILKEDKGQITIQNAIRSDLRVLSVHKGKITAEKPTHDPSSPLYYCSECRDTVDYRIRGARFQAVTSDE